MFIKRLKRKTKKVELLVVLLFLLVITSNIQTIMDFMLNCFILILLGGLVYLIIQKSYYLIRYGHKEFSNEEIEFKIDNMNSREFEIFCNNLFKQLGYKTKLTKQTIDGGKDIVLKSSNSEKIYVECKHWNKNNLISRDVLQKLIGACIGDNIQKAIFITTSNYTDRAYKYASNIKWLELWTKKDLIKAMNNINKQWVVLYNLKEEH